MNYLHKSLLSALQPCPHFSGVCAAHCRWDPQNGHIPRGFGGAISKPKDVQLVIVTAEPGDPADIETYSGSPEKMLQDYLEFFDKAMKGGLTRKGRPSPFHRNMRTLIDLFWPDESIDEQLTKTWFTDAVLCSAKVQGGVIPKLVEDTCSEYLRRQIELLPNAKILALGGKAQQRMLRNQIRIDLSADHPSPRNYTKAKHSWEKAARHFRAYISARPKSRDKFF